MVDPVVSSSTPRYVEMGRDFRTASDGGRNLEVAMAATMFRDLQNAGLIDRNARLADTPPNDASGAASGVGGTSYEARLVSLIRDRDSNGRLDIDMDRLRDSGLLSRSATTSELESAVSGRPREQLSDQFIARQARNSQLNDFGVAPNARGRTVQTYSRGMVLTGSQDRATSEWSRDLGTRAAQSPEEARRVANEAITGAQALNGRGDQRNAQEILVRSGDALQQAGRLDDARRVYSELQRSPYRDTQVNLVQSQLDRERARVPDFQEGRHVVPVDSPHSHATIDPTDYRSTYGQLADRRIAQIDQTQRMQQATGRADFDPRNMDHVRDYFQTYSRGENGTPRGTDEVRREYQSYMQNFYAHSGDGVEWTSSIPPNDRAGRMTEILRDQPRDASGRAIIDCEGYTYMTDSILGGVRNADGTQRFDVLYAERPGHVTTGVFDRNTGSGFSQNNGDTAMYEGNFAVATGRQRRGAPPPSVAAGTARWDDTRVANAVARSMGGNSYNVIGLGRTPDAANATEEGGLPRVGAYIYDGDRLLGQVTPAWRQAYADWRDRQFGNNTFSHFLGAVDRGDVPAPR